ncbi:MAG: ArsR/SmtB family transcription factor [Jatrophihabitans sp.]
MSLVIDLGVTELAGSRFAISPLSETVAGLQQLGGVGRPGNAERWVRWALDDLAGQPLVVPRTWRLLVNDRSSWPQFLLPAPATSETTLDDAFEVLRRTTAQQVRASLRRVFGADLPEPAAELAARPAAGLRAITAELRVAHDRLIAPHWPRIRAVLDADIAYRARQLATGGADLLFANLHPDLHWRRGRLTLDHDDRPRPVNPGRLVLVPVVVGSAHVQIKGHTTTQTTVRYPARGVGALWTAGTRPPRRSAVRVLGRVRAELLDALRTPATTTDLARTLGVTPSAVSQQLAVLRESRLVVGERSGRTVRYQTTDRGLALLDPRS